MPEHLTEHHRLISQQKRAAVLHAADAMIDQGVAFHWTTLARRARVSVKFINDPKHADLKEHVKERLATAYDHQAAQTVAASNATAAQLRVKVANHAAQLRRQDHMIKTAGAQARRTARQRDRRRSCPRSPARRSRPSPTASGSRSSSGASSSSKISCLSVRRRSTGCARRCARGSATGEFE